MASHVLMSYFDGGSWVGVGRSQTPIDQPRIAITRLSVPRMECGDSRRCVSRHRSSRGRGTVLAACQRGAAGLLTRSEAASPDRRARRFVETGLADRLRDQGAGFFGRAESDRCATSEIAPILPPQVADD